MISFGSFIEFLVIVISQFKAYQANLRQNVCVEVYKIVYNES